jgi:hypothetical protein
MYNLYAARSLAFSVSPRLEPCGLAVAKAVANARDDGEGKEEMGMSARKKTNPAVAFGCQMGAVGHAPQRPVTKSPSSEKGEGEEFSFNVLTEKL